MANLPKISASSVSRNYKILFLIPILIGAAAFIFLPDSLVSDPFFIGAGTLSVVGMTWGCVRYGWNEAYREKVRKYKAEQKKLLKNERDGYVLGETNKWGIITSIIGFLLWLIVAKIFIFFDIK